MDIKRVQFKAENEILVGNIVTDNNVDKPSLLFIHGAGQTTTKERVRSLALKLAEHHISSFGFDFSGHGESTGKLEESSLYKRTKEAKEALKFLNTEKPISVCAFSMGGHVALDLLRTESIKTLLLFCPAIYAKEAFHAPFNGKFSDIIREKESWRKTDVLDGLETFSGNLFICIGEMDNIIPKGVIELLDGSSSKAQKKEIMVLKNANHHLMRWFTENEDVMDSVVEKFLYFLS